MRKIRNTLTLFVACLAISMQAMAKPSPEAFGKLPSIYDAAISPDARQLAVLATFDDTYGIQIVSLGKEDEKLRAILLGEGVKPMWIRWVNNERVLVGIWQSSKFRGVPITSSFIYTLDANKMKGQHLIKPRDIFRQDNSDVIDFLDSDPDYILMGFSTEDQFISDIRKVNVVNGRHRRIKRGNPSIQAWYTDNRGEPRIGQGLRDSQSGKEDWRLTVRDADGKKWRDSKEYPDLAADSAIFGFTSSPNELIVGDYAGKNTLGLYVYDLTMKQISRKLFHNDAFDATGIIINSDTDEVIGARYVADAPEVELFDEYDSLMDRMRDKFSDYTIQYVDQSNDGQVLIFKASNASEPGALLMVTAGKDTDDISAENVSLISHYRPELPTQSLGGVVSVSYRARDGALLPGYVTLPPSIDDDSEIRNLPFIILPHGGPYARTSKRFDYFAQFFATRGYGVLQMNFRGSSGYGKTFEESGRKNWVVMQEDVTDGARWLIRKGYADPERMCIAGWSYGGYAALMGAIKNPDMYSCAVSMAGVTDLKDMINDIKKYRFGKLTARQFILEGFESKDDIKENSPMRRADELKVPLFLAHGTRDQRVHFDQFKRMKSALRKSDADVTYVEFKDEDHFLSEQENRQEFFVKLDQFLTETIGESEHAQ